MTVKQSARTRPPELASERVQQFSEQLRGPLLQPDDAGYDNARRIWNGMIDKRPALIARCAGTADVIAAVTFAREHDLLVSVRGGGHNVAGNAVCDDGLMIDLSAMKSIRVDPGARTARAEPGVLWQEFDAETQAHGLATTGGVVGSTGIAGFTLGGGVGWLNGVCGLACDNLLSADVVTADGKLRRASPVEHTDLFWALRGGGGNFGIVTSFKYQLHPLGQVLGGPIFHALEDASEVLRFFREFTANAPDELGTETGIITDPDGNRIIGIVVCYAGDLAEGERVIEPLRRFGNPLADMIGPMPYTTLQSMFDPAFPSDRQNYWKSTLLHELSDDALDVVEEYGAAMESPHSMVFLEHFHGAYSRVGPNETAYRHRDTPYNLLILTNWENPSESDTHVTWARDCFNAIQPHAANKVPVNFLGSEGDERIRNAYGENYDRLVEIKARYDPTNFFRLNQNIKPG